MSFHFDPNTPIYLQLIEIFSKEIASEMRKPGEKVDPVRELAIQYGVNPNTMQRALAAMESEGLMYSDRTRGRFVTEDAGKVLSTRQELAEKVLLNFIEQMKELHFNKKDALKKIDEYWEAHDEFD